MGGRKPPLTTDVSVVTPTTYQAQEPDWTIRALRDLVQESIDNPSRVLVDVREAEEYCGALSPTWKLPEEGTASGTQAAFSGVQPADPGTVDGGISPAGDSVLDGLADYLAALMQAWMAAFGI